MLATLSEAFLPGARQLRPPMISGILWTLLFWFIFAPYIPDSDSATGWAKQVYSVIGAAGPIATAVVLAILVFVLGSMLLGISDAVTALVGRLATSAQRTFLWQRHAQRARRELRRKIAILAAAIEEFDERSTDELTDAKREEFGNSEKPTRRDHAALVAKLSMVERHRLRMAWIPNTARTQGALGTPPALAGEGLEAELVTWAWRQGIHAIAEEQQEVVSDNDLYQHDPRTGTRGLERELQAELDPDPLEVVRALSEARYLDLDRDRSERDVRLAIASPALLFGIYAALFSNAWWLTVCLLPLSFIVRYSFQAAQENTRVLRLLRSHDLKTFALRRAFETGRMQARAFIEEERRERERDREAQETAAREREALRQAREREAQGATSG